ncbi:MAG TPA: glycosyltransferase [Phycisphaerales bacterium]|nr:glycosyltransferase [Phycisphaerales bacterium]
MRICLASREFAPFQGWGAGTYASLMAQALAAQGHEVHVLFADAADIEKAQALRRGVTFHAVDMADEWVRLPAFSAEPQRYSYAAYRALLRLHERHRFDCIEFPDFLGEAYFTLRGRRTLGQFEGAVITVRLHMTVRHIRTLNHDDWIDLERATVEHMEAWSLRHADALIAPCPQMGDHIKGFLSSEGGVMPPVRVIENPFTSEQLRELGAPAQSAATPPTAPTVVYAGRLERRKGVQTLVDAAIRLLGEPETAHTVFRFVGEDTLTGPLGTSMRAWMEQRIRGSGLSPESQSRVRFEPRVPRAALAGVYADATCACFPSLWENFPYACAEAMALGVPVVGSSSGGMAHMMEHGRSGLLCDGADPASLADALRTMLADAALRERCAAEAPARVAHLCDPARIATQTESLVRELSQRCADLRRIQRPLPSRVRGDEPEVSIIIPVFNLHQHLPDTLASIRAQSLTHWEAIIIDDGSTDPATAAALDELSGANTDPRVRVIRARHGGLSHARNVGLHAARGRFIFPVDADDMLAPNLLEQCLRVHRSHENIGFVTAFLRHFRESADRPVAGWIPFGGDHDWMGVMNAASNAAAMMPRSLLLDIGGYDEELPAYEDWDLFASILERGYRGEVIPEFSILYRLRPGSIMHSIDPKRHHLLRARLLAKHPGMARNNSRAMRLLLGDSVDIYALGKPLPKPDEDPRVFRLAQEMLHQNIRYKAADKLNVALRRMGVHGAIKMLVNGR